MGDGRFHLKSAFRPTGDQPQAIDAICEGLNAGMRYQTLLGVTGSGKTFTMANVIERMNRPTLILEPNKTLAAQLCTEMREFFPDAAVEFFVSYYDYYQPEAYIPGKDMYIEKDAAINDEIDRLRHSATAAVLERRDVIIVASVSCIYSLGDPADYKNMMLSLRPGMEMSRDELIRRLVRIQYERNDLNFVRTKFRVRGDTVDIYPTAALRIRRCAWNFSGMRSIACVSSVWSRGKFCVSCGSSVCFRPLTTRCRTRKERRRWSRSTRRCRSACCSLRQRTS